MAIKQQFAKDFGGNTMGGYAIINGEEYAKITFNPHGNIEEQIEELSPKSLADIHAIHDEIWDNMTNTVFMDECGQLWVMRSHGLQYLAKCKA